MWRTQQRMVAGQALAWHGAGARAPGVWLHDAGLQARPQAVMALCAAGQATGGAYARLGVLAQAGHLPPLEAPATVAAAVRAVAGRDGPSRGAPGRDRQPTLAAAP